MKKIILILFCLLSIVCFAQKNRGERAEKYYQKYSFDKAIQVYTKMDTLQVDELKKLAISYFNKNDFEAAEKTYVTFIESPFANIDDYFNYVLVLKSSQKYAESDFWMEKILQNNPFDLRAKSFSDNKSNFQTLLSENKSYKIKNLKINSKDEDFGTSYCEDKIVFTSSRKGANFILRNYNWNRKPFLDIYVAQVDSFFELNKPKLWNKKANKKWHEGPASFNNDGTFAVFTRNNYTDTLIDDIVRLELFFSEFKDKKWSIPEPFYLNNPSYSVSHPCLINNGKGMFFVSDMPGGYGGTDIYYVQKDENNTWGELINLGKNINTEANEMFPFFEEQSGLLFFSSNGLMGLGGLDVFVAEYTPNGFEKPLNLGSPINTSYDDFAFIINKTLTQGYFSSNRSEGKGGDDIYHFLFSGKYAFADCPCKNNLFEKSSQAFVDNLFVDTSSLIVNQENKIVLKNIYYDFDKWDILPESKKELDKVVEFMNHYPDYIVELSAHTDSRGSDAYNLKLSEKRAKSAVAYIISKGIDTTRITAKGCGETQPIHVCLQEKDCSEQEHRENRRTEIFIPEFGKAEHVKQTKGKQ